MVGCPCIPVSQIMGNPEFITDKIITMKEKQRLQDHYNKKVNWLKFGPYLSERQWGTVREDYSEGGAAWDYFPHDHARSRAYRWGEDGIAGISDDLQRICFAIALWNGNDPILKERLFGLAGPEGNHGEDVKELYYYLDNTPTHSYMKHLYKYPQASFPYQELVEVNRNRSRQEPEFELLDTGVLNDNRYFDVFTEYAKNTPDDILIKITVANRGVASAPVYLLPTLWFRNLWTPKIQNIKPSIRLKKSAGSLYATLDHSELGNYNFYFEPADRTLFTENESNKERLWDQPNASPFVKDAFHRAVINNDYEWMAGQQEGTKFAPLYYREVPGKAEISVYLRLSKKSLKAPFDARSLAVLDTRRKEADQFYSQIVTADRELANIQRQAFAGMLWSKQTYNIDIPTWLKGDEGQVPPPASRSTGRNSQWRTLNNHDIISMPDKWEYPWYAAWDLAFHCVPLAMVDTQFAKDQLILFLREWYMHPNGQIPAYEWAFGDVNPPVHAWSCLMVYRMEKARSGKGDIDFLKRVFHKLMLNFTWWVNRKDSQGKNVFEGGFLGLDNIGIFDRSSAIPGGGHLEQADGTSWMAMYCLNLLDMALEITAHDPAFEDVTTKFFEHFAYIAESLNRIGNDWTGAWDEKEGFFYDVLALPDKNYIPLKVRSLVGLTTLLAVLPLDRQRLEKAPDFLRRLEWFVDYQEKTHDYQVLEEMKDNKILLSLTTKERLKRLLEAMFDESEFLSPNGIRALSKIHQNGYSNNINGQEFGLTYEPGESSSGLFGGNSNWRGPIWMPLNYLLVQSLKSYHQYYGDEFQVEFPTKSGRYMNLEQVSNELSKRLIGIFQPEGSGHRPVNNHDNFYLDEHFKDLVLFYEYFHGDTGRGVGATHQTGWTGVVAELIDHVYYEV